ncbi:hypothetical protein RQP46_005406 [Phenoliferia psychrophenolica]
MKPFLELTASEMATGIDLNVMGAFHFSQLAIPYMLEAPPSPTGASLIFSGATAALKGGAKFAAFAPSKFALRGLSFIDTPALTQHFGPPKTEGERIAPDSIADAFVYLSQQDKSCWTQELDLRPSVEKF